MASRGENVKGKNARGRKKKDAALKTRYSKVPLQTSTFELWRSLRTELGFATDNDLALALMESYRRNLERGFTSPQTSNLMSTPFPRRDQRKRENRNVDDNGVDAKRGLIASLEVSSVYPEEESSVKSNTTMLQVSGVFEHEEDGCENSQNTVCKESAKGDDSTCTVKESAKEVLDNEWCSDDESSDDNDDSMTDIAMMELNALTKDMKIGADYYLRHSSAPLNDEEVILCDPLFAEDDESESINTTFCNVNKEEQTILDDLSMEWEPTEGDTILLGYGKSNKVSLPPEYYKSFCKGKKTLQDLSLVEDEKFICSSTQIENLIEAITCIKCGEKNVIKKKAFVESVQELWRGCKNWHTVKWSSSDKVNGVYAINLQAMASIVLSGNLYAKISLMAKFLNLKLPSEVTFYRIAKLYVNPAIDHWWDEMQSLLYQLFKGKELFLGADGRNDSPGHSATYCTYTFMDPVSNLILHQEIVDLREVEFKSPNMEKLGCKNGLEVLRKNVKMKGLVTDDHNQISAMMTKDEEYKDLEFQKDVWHKSSKLTKKLSQVAKERGNQKILTWIPTIRNHFWHCSSVSHGNLALFKDTWLNLLKHLCNLHYDCNHGPLETLERTDWFSPSDPDFGVIREMILDKRWLNSMKFYTKFRHTGEIEVYHNHLLMYASKRIFFKYPSYKARNLLATIDHNHHTQLPHVRNEFGDLMYSRRWSKKAGRWIPTIIKEPKDFAYIPTLLASILNSRRHDDDKISRAIPLSSNDPRKIACSIAKLPPKPTKLLVDEKMSRFKKS